MNGPRLTEERLRYHLDSNQVMRERMCLALLPLLGAFSDGRPRRPKGGPDGSRDIECLYKGTIPTWGGVGFRNGGGNDSDARNAAKKKFRDDLDGALEENPPLASFIFFTNVDLTPGDKDQLCAYAAKKNIHAVHIFDLEILRHALDSRDGLLAREQYLDIPISGDGGPTKPTDEPRAVQSSKVASCYWPLKFPTKPGADKLDEEVVTKYLGLLLESLCRCFAHTCVVTGIEDFVFLLTFDKAACRDLPGYIRYDLKVVCHITEFVRSLEERLSFLMKESTLPPPRLKTLSGDQILEQRLRLGRDLPHRVYRIPPTGIVIEYADNVPPPPSKITTTSQLLCLLAAGFKHKVVLWDEIETYPDAGKVMKMFDRTAKAGFSWNGIKLDPDNPESWEYHG